MIARHVDAVARFDEGRAFGRQAHRRAGFRPGAIPLALEAARRMRVLAERPRGPGHGAVEEVGLAPEHLFEIGFHAGIFHGCNQVVEDVGDREGLAIGHRARIGPVEGAVATELQLVWRLGGLVADIVGAFAKRGLSSPSNPRVLLFIGD